VSCLHHLFESRVDRDPKAPALVCGDVTLSYDQVEERANQLARYLKAQGVKTGERVGLFVERSPDAIVAILSILKAGAAYLPLDPSHPAERNRHIVDEASITTVVSEHALGAGALEFLETARVKVVAIDDPARPWQACSTARLSDEETGVSPSDLCYVLYTSGSTGRPKGVMTEHRNVVAFVAAFNEVVRVSETDRVFQGFSLGFDGSVEEMWMAFSNGGALVVPPRGAARFGDDLAQLIERGQASVFSTVPTALALISQSLPTVRLLIVSGERCPKETVKRWAIAGRRMLNVYGPTETTVNATVAECAPDHAVTIGRPLRGYGLHILDDARRPVAPGEKGELFITGPGVARGYLGQPALTERHFLDELPVGPEGEAQRAYQTGDLVSVDAAGDLLFHGRLDHQIKVRGYRIELAEIENVLCEDEAIRTAVVTVVERNGASTLAAHVLAQGPAGRIDRDRILAHLTTRLPPYMIPGFLDVVDALPMLASGKVDRACLPAPAAALARSGRTMRGPSDALEEDLLGTYVRLLGNESISTDDDFFRTLGGYSLLAAQLASALRRELGLEVAIRDIYNHPTIVQLAAHLRSKQGTKRARPESARARAAVRASVRRRFARAAHATRTAAVALQGLGLYAVYAVLAVPYLGSFLATSAWKNGHISFAACVGAWLAVWLATWPALLALSVAAKWILIGRYRPGVYPLWGWYYLRFWLVRRFQMITGSAFLAGTPLFSLYLRAMGAKVGAGCTVSTPSFGIFDLLTIGDDTSIGVESQLLGYRVEDGQLFIGSIDIGNRCFVGTHAALGVDVRMGNNARLDDQSLLPDGGWIPPGESRRGSPAQPATVSVPEPALESPSLRPRKPILYGFLHLLVLYAMFLLLVPTALPSCALLLRAEEASSAWWLIAAIPVAGTATIVTFCLWLALLNHLLLPKVRPGVYRVESRFYLRKWASDLLMHLSRSLARPVYTTIYLPAWLRLLGAHIGRRAEISTVSQISPKLTHIGDQSFFADGSMIGGNRIHRGLLHLAESRIGRRSFVGNGAILPVGASLGDDCLIGCLSAPPAGYRRTPDGTEWLGSPSFALPYRPRVGGFDPSVTHEPTRKLIAQRLLIDALRIVLPSTLLTGAVVVLTELVAYAHERLPQALWLLGIPVAEIAVAAAALLCVVAAKKILIGTFVPTVQPLWSTYVWFNEALNGTYETVAAPVLTLLLGSPFVNPWLRLMGCKIGRDVYTETTLFSEFDLVHIGDGVALNAGSVVQNHLFEDRIMKVSLVEIGDYCTVGNMAVVLYDTEMQTGSSIGPLSLLMKGEVLAPRTQWVGIPTAQAVPQIPALTVVPLPTSLVANLDVDQDVTVRERFL
jgi:non-ribosomal peptide synthetase-like protein